MDVVRRPACRHKHTPLGPKDAPNVLIQPGLQVGVEGRCPVPSAEDQVKVEAGKGLGHGQKGDEGRSPLSGLGCCSAPRFYQGLAPPGY